MKLTLRTRGAPAKPIEQRKANPRLRQDRPLTSAQQIFVSQYLVTMCGTDAYRAAYPRANDSTARKEASKLMADPRVARQIRLLTAELCARYRHSAKRTLDEVAALAYSNAQDFLDDDGSFRSPRNIPRVLMAAVKRIEADEIYGAVGEDGERKVVGRKVRLELHDKVAPLRLLAQHYNLLVEQVQVSPGRDFAAILEAAGQRVVDAARQRAIDGIAERDE